MLCRTQSREMHERVLADIAACITVIGHKPEPIIPSQIPNVEQRTWPFAPELLAKINPAALHAPVRQPYKQEISRQYEEDAQYVTWYLHFQGTDTNSYSYTDI